MCKFDVEVLKRAIGIKSPSLEKVEVTYEAPEETVEPTPDPPVEEWIWVTGYKGMDKNMRCYNDFQYELGQRYDMPEDAKIEECSSGFHFCLTMDDVFNYVSIGDSNRFFEVKALVRKSDYDKYGSEKRTWTGAFHVRNGMIVADNVIDKLVAKSIEIVRELTVDEILENTEAKDWDARHKGLVISNGINKTQSIIQMDELVEYGYSLPFAQWLVNNHKYDVAKAVGSQTDLSMDMKCLMIMNG